MLVITYAVAGEAAETLLFVAIFISSSLKKVISWELYGQSHKDVLHLN